MYHEITNNNYFEGVCFIAFSQGNHWKYSIQSTCRVHFCRNGAKIYKTSPSIYCLGHLGALKVLLLHCHFVYTRCQLKRKSKENGIRVARLKKRNNSKGLQCIVIYGMYWNPLCTVQFSSKMKCKNS